MTATPDPLDYLKYAAAVVRERIEWTTDEIGGSMCNLDHDLQLDAISDLRGDIDALVAPFGEANRYSDGRAVKSGKWIELGVYTSHVWHPDPTQEKARSWRGNLMHDPGTPCPGIYEVTITPATQEIHVRVIRIADPAHQGGDQ